MKDVNKSMLKVAILAIGLQEIGGGAASPALASIMKAFPDISPTTIMQISSLPALTTMLFAPIYGKLVNYFSKRSLAIFALALFIISGVLPGFIYTNIYIILVFRAILGISIGILLPMSAGLIADFYEGQERASMMGLSQTVGSLGGMYFQMAGGFLAAISWQYCFFAYFMTTIVLIIAFLFLPEPARKEVQSGEKAKIPGQAYPTFLWYFLFQVLIMVMVTNVSVLIEDAKMGDPGTVGIALTIFTAGAMLFGLFFGSVYKLFKEYTMALAYAFLTTGFAICFWAASLPMVYLGCFIIGFGACTTTANTFQRISIQVPPSAVAFALSIAVFFLGIGNFIEPYVFDVILKALHLNIGRPPFGVAAVILTAGTIILLFANTVSKKQEPA